MASQSNPFALFAAGAGVAALIAGAFTLANMGLHIATLQGSTADATGRSVLIAGELAEVAAFTIAALACAVSASRAWLSVVAVLKFVVFVGLLAGYWKLWYFMLDFRGPDALSLIVIFLSGLQAALLVAMAVAPERLNGL